VTPPPKPSYFKLAFANPYNLALVLGGVTASILTANPIPAMIALGGEGLWLLHAPDSRFLRKTVWDPKLEAMQRELDERMREQRVASLPQNEQSRVRRLYGKKDEIDNLGSQNPSFTADLLRGELSKTRKLADSFLEMALTCARYERYLGSVDFNALERDRTRWSQKTASDKTPPQERDLAKKNLAVIEKRIEKLKDIRDYLGVARGQLDLIENSFQLIADQIVTMQSPAELSGQLDDLLDGVESIKQTAVDTERILNTLEV
jgi:hypothetical protein